MPAPKQNAPAPTTTTTTENAPSNTPSPSTTITPETFKHVVDYKMDTIVERTNNYQIKAQYPIFEGDKLTPILKQQNEQIADLVRKKVADFKAAAATEEKTERAWFMEVIPTLVYANNRLVSVAFSSMEEFGGAHPNLLEFAYNYDLQKREVITAKNSFADDYKATLLPLMRKNVMEVYYGGGEGCDIAEYEVEPTTFSFDLDKLIFYFPELPHVCGHPIAEIKYAEIPADVILPESALASRY